MIVIDIDNAILEYKAIHGRNPELLVVKYEVFSEFADMLESGNIIIDVDRPQYDFYYKDVKLIRSEDMREDYLVV